VRALLLRNHFESDLCRRVVGKWGGQVLASARRKERKGVIHEENSMSRAILGVDVEEGNKEWRFVFPLLRGDFFGVK